VPRDGAADVASMTGVALLGALAAVLAVARRSWRRRRSFRRLLPDRPRRSATPAGGRVGSWLTPRLEAADLAIDPAVAARCWLAAVGGLAALAGAVGGLGLLVVGLAAGVLLPVIALAAVDDRRDARLERELPALLEAVARSLRSGAAIPAALREAADTGSLAAEDLAFVLGDVDRGRPLTGALDRWTERRPVPGVRLAVGALTVALASGGAPARAVDGVAATLRERAEVDREVRALATQARASAVVITVSPLAFAALGVLGDERTATFLLRTPSGLACLAVGVALDGLGAWWMTHIAGRMA
jgi:tight adherence protein B